MRAVWNTMTVGEEFPKFTNYILAEAREGKSISVVSDCSSGKKKKNIVPPMTDAECNKPPTK